MNIEKEIEKLNEFRKIIKATCLSCGKETTNEDALQIMNDSDSVCLDCDEYFIKWETKKTIIITTEIQDCFGNSHYFREESLNA